MSNLKKSEDNTQTRSTEVLSFIPLAVERTGSEISREKMINMSRDICNEFSKVNIDVIKSAMRKGALGNFGSTYKLTTQEVCIWIRKELKWRREHNEDGSFKPTI